MTQDFSGARGCGRTAELLIRFACLIAPSPHAGQEMDGVSDQRAVRTDHGGELDAGETPTRRQGAETHQAFANEIAYWAILADTF
jgi:hypothetical protein